MLGQVHDPDLHLLRLFVTVVEAGGFSAAQGVLGLSQPTISQRMAQLEARLGYRLCSRGKGGFRLTEKGELLLEAARGLLLNIEQFRQQANGVAGRLLGTVRIGMAENQDKAVSLKLAAAIAAFRRREESVQLELVSARRRSWNGCCWNSGWTMPSAIFPATRRPLITSPCSRNDSGCIAAGGMCCTAKRMLGLSGCWTWTRCAIRTVFSKGANRSRADAARQWRSRSKAC